MIFATAIEKDGFTFSDCLNNLPVVPLPYGADLRARREVWMTPVGTNGAFQGYRQTAWVTGSAAPTVDSFRATVVYDAKTGEHYTIVANLSAINGAADGATVSPNTIPVPVLPYRVCAGSDGDYHFTWTALTKAGADEYRAYVKVDGVQGTAAASGGHASIAAMITWLNTNYSAAGTWSNPAGNIVALTSSTNKEVGLTITVGNYA